MKIKEVKQKIKFVSDALGTIGGERMALQKFDSSKITTFLIENRTFKNRSESLQNHPTNIFRPVENLDIEKT